MKVRLFVYGLLRRGDEMASLLDGAQSLGPATVDGFDLYDAGPYPAAVRGTGTLVGELYELPGPGALASLDAAEGLFRTPPLYRRESVPASGRLAWLYVYNGDVSAFRRIESGDWFVR
ncbi:MAG: gamma-glutamylcyclotransferase [Planctomycetota bacterium]|nr:gamma-glutamylcyclotransferase [Planctomycetota bacterium]